MVFKSGKSTGGFMVEVREIGKYENPPEDADWIVIKPTPAGKFIADACIADCISAAFSDLRTFNTLERAISASKRWAERNNIPIVYVKSG